MTDPKYKKLLDDLHIQLKILNKRAYTSPLIQGFNEIPHWKKINVFQINLYMGI